MAANAYWIGSAYDRQSRRAIGAAFNSEQLAGVLPLLQNAGLFPPGRQSTDLPPAFAAPKRARPDDSGYIDSSEIWLFGKDNVPPSKQSFDLPPRAPARAPDYTWLQSLLPVLAGRDATNPGGQSTDLPPRAASRARDYSITQGFTLELIGKDNLPTGKQSTDLPPSGPARARDYSYVFSFPLELIGQDNLPTGRQSTDLPPRGPARLSDYSWIQPTPLNLVGRDAVNPGQQSLELPPRAPQRARDYSLAEAFPLELIGQGTVVPGGQSFDLPPRGALRAADYTHTQSTKLVLFGLDNVPPGQQSTDLPTRAPARLCDYTWLQSLLPVLKGQDALTIGDQVTDLAPSPAALRLRDYTHTQSTPLNLIGRDALVPGRQSTDLAPPAAPRARDYTFAPPANLLALTTIVQPIPYGRQSTDLPPTFAAPLRARDYSFTGRYTLELIGKDALPVGDQFTDLPPSAAPRAVDYTFAPPANLNSLLTPPVGAQLTDLPPTGPARARDYSFTASFPLELIGKDAVVPGKQSVDLPPIGAQRARDYSFVPPVNLLTLTTVVQQTPPGEQATDLPLPPSAARARDYSIAEAFPLELIGKDALPVGEQSTDLAPRAPLRLIDYTFAPAVNLPVLTVAAQLALNQQQSFDLPATYSVARRARDYSQTVSYTLVLIGRDNVPPGDQSCDLPPIAPARWSQLNNPAGVLHRGITYLGRDTIYAASGEAPTYDYPNPRPYPRLVDYTQINSFPLQVYQQLPIGQSTLDHELPPRAPARMRDYTWVQTVALNLLGKDALPVGRQHTALPPHPEPFRLEESEYTITNRLDLPAFVALQKPGHHTLTHRELFAHTLSDRALFVHTLTDVEGTG